MDIYDVVEKKIDQIEAELQRLGRWQDSPLSAELLENLTPFGIDRMTPAQRLQFVLVPRVREILTNRSNFPEKSDVAIWAAHHFEDEEQKELIHLLGEFDLLINDRIAII